jgi:M3 family oligoendopeptidase
MIPDNEILRQYRRPDPTEIEREQRDLAGAAANGAALVDTVERWNNARVRVDTLRNIASLRYQQDTEDAAAKAEEDFWNDHSPLLRELDALHARTLIAAPGRDAIDRRFGPQLLRLMGAAATTFAPEIRDAIAEEARLCTDYTRLCARSDVAFRGEKTNMSAIAAFFVDADRATRLEAQAAREGFLSMHGDELDALYSRLVELRDGMGRALGHRNFVPLGYTLMSRTDYGPDDVATFRDEIRREVVPVVSEIRRAQARRLGLDRILFHDEPVGDPGGNPRPEGGVDFCVSAARGMYREMSTEIGDFFDMMVKLGLMDLETRPGKAGGGFCTHFADSGLPFVFANFNGTDADVNVLTHECGHALQAWKSRHHPLLEYRFPTSEACEIHSMGMELLASPWYARFFANEGEAERYRRIQMEQTLCALPYMAAVDHFQHEIYAAPTMTPAERRATWCKMESIYLPHRDYGGLFPHLAKGTLWQRQLHIYLAPFYYIDYALAETCALQIFARAESDRAAALTDYMAMCTAGGSVSFLGMVAAGRLRSPFEKGCLAGVVDVARRTLGL